jgi:hypothetical protein
MTNKNKKMTLALKIVLGVMLVNNAFAQNEMLHQNGLVNRGLLDVPNNQTNNPNLQGQNLLGQQTNPNILLNKTNVKVTRLVQIGVPTGNLEPLKGFAKDLPLKNVLEQLVPNGWVVKKAQGKEINLAQTVSWTGQQNWIEALNEISVKNNLDITVNWNTKEITVAQGTLSSNSVSPSIQPINPAKESNVAVVNKNYQSGVFELTQVPVGGSPSVPPQNTNQVAVPKEKLWSFKGFDNLQDLVEAWGKSAGYNVKYLGENYPLDPSSLKVYTGNFEDLDKGPISRLASSYGKNSRVKVPLSFEFWNDRVLVIENIRYEQSATPQYNNQ